MIGGHRVIAVIPARSGSKRLKNKNIRKLNGLSLLKRSCLAAKESKYIDFCIVSSDNRDYSKEMPTDDFFIFEERDKNLSSDSSSIVDVLIGLREPLKNDDYIILLQPTSPLRNSIDIDGCIELASKSRSKSSVSVCLVDHPLEWSGEICRNNSIQKFGIFRKLNIRSQDLPTAFRINGAIYVMLLSKIKETGACIEPSSKAFEMPRWRSIDIDTEYDLQIAQAIEQMYNISTEIIS